MNDKIEIVHKRIWNEFIHPNTALLMDFINPGISLEERFSHLPTVEEVRNDIPNQCGWASGMEDCAIHGALYLETMINRYELTRKKEDLLKVKRILSGLFTLYNSTKKKGFIPRSVHPSDKKTHYSESSRDQYTHYIYGLWYYYNSSVAEEKEKKEIKRIISDIAEWVNSNGDTIKTEKGEKGWVSDISKLKMEHGPRLLQVYAAAYDITKDKKWHKKYIEKRDEEEGARIEFSSSTFPIEPDRKWIYVHLQMQLALRLLYEVEKEKESKYAYRKGLDFAAREVKRALPWLEEYNGEVLKKPVRYDWRGYFQKVKPDTASLSDIEKFVFGLYNRQKGKWMLMRTVKSPLEAVMVMLNSINELTDSVFLIKEYINRFLKTVNFEKIQENYISYLEYVYYKAKILGVI